MSDQPEVGPCPSPTPTVLIVDDDPSLREMLRRLLEKHQHTVLAAPDAETALQILSGQSVSVALIDRRLPGRDGLWLLDQMSEQFPSVAIILATADDSVPLRYSLQPSVVGYLVKPFTPELLVNSISDAAAWNRVASKRGG